MKLDFDALDVKVPADGDIVWRYVKLLDLVPLIEHSQLPFIRLDQFGDKYEASIPRQDFWDVVEEQRRATKGRRMLTWGPPPETEDQKAQLAHYLAEADARAEKAVKASADRRKALDTLRSSVYASCWHWGRESEAMWRIYCREVGGMAISTTFGQLKAGLNAAPFPLPLHFGMVRYFDYAAAQFPDDNLAWAVLSKKDAFEHEKELRVIAFDQSGFDVQFQGSITPNAYSNIQFATFDYASGLRSIVSNPYDEGRHADVAVNMLRRLEPKLAALVQESELRGHAWR